MLGLLNTLQFVLPLAYAAVFALYMRQFLRTDDVEESPLPRRGLYLVLTMHVAFFVLRGVELGFMPFASKPDFLSLVALSIGIVYTFIEFSQKQGRTGVFFVAPALLGQSISAVLMDYDKKHPLLLENPIYGVHVIFLVLGLTALAVGALYALMYVLMTRQLKSRELGVFFKRLPPLMKLDRMSRLGTGSGIALVGLGLCIGALLGTTIEGFDILDPKIVVSFVIWFGYLAGVGITKVRGLSGDQTAWVTMLWFVVFMFSVGLANHSFT